MLPPCQGGFWGVRLCHPQRDLCPAPCGFNGAGTGELELQWGRGAAGSPEDGLWMLRGHFLAISARLHLRRGSGCWPGAEDGEEPGLRMGRNRPSRNHLTQPGEDGSVCHPGHTWAWRRRGGAGGRGAAPHHPCVTQGKGTSRFPALSHPGWETGAGVDGQRRD